MKVLQQSQVDQVVQKLAWAGIRNKELAVYIIGLRMILPIVLGVIGFVPAVCHGDQARLADEARDGDGRAAVRRVQGP